jgi:D-alanine-D-alanine ligase
VKVVIVHQALSDEAAPDEADVVAQREAVQAALLSLGHQASTVTFTLDLEAGRRALEAERPDLVFNLVESLGGSGRLLHFGGALFEVMGLPYTGCSAASIYETSNKILAKRKLETAGLPTPAWYEPNASGFQSGRYIVKSLVEHASVGLGDDSVVDVSSPSELDQLLALRRAKLGGSAFAERYVEGREINVSVLDGRVLPPDEIVFIDFPPEKPRIIGYECKWNPNSMEFRQTAVRTIPPEDAPLVEKLSQLALAAWRLFDLSGFARVDFRVADHDEPFILEINANPCISPDAGFARALGRAGLRFEDAIRVLVETALRGRAAA